MSKIKLTAFPWHNYTSAQYAAGPLSRPYITTFKNVPQGMYANDESSRIARVASLNKIIVRLKGGLGNQLFCYGAARSLSLKNNAELVIDDVSGFQRDIKYKRQYTLMHFSIPARMATAAERLEPFERYRRGLAKWHSRRLPFEQRTYLEQEFRDFDPRLLALRLEGNLYLDGLWQSEAYFADNEEVIRQDLTIKPPTDRANQNMAARIADCANAVALHVRWFEAPVATESSRNVSGDYYQRVIKYVQSRVEQPHFFLFSDDPAAAVSRLSLPTDGYTVVSHNMRNELAYADLWLMSQCRHFITANSTFSWWGAWLGEKANSLVIVPNPDSFDPDNSWRTKGLLPSRWTKL